MDNKLFELHINSVSVMIQTQAHVHLQHLTTLGLHLNPPHRVARGLNLINLYVNGALAVSELYLNTETPK